MTGDNVPETRRWLDLLASRPGFAPHPILPKGQPAFGSFDAPLAGAADFRKPLRNTQSKLTGPPAYPGLDLFSLQGPSAANRFVVIGDSGSGAPIQQAIAAQMLRMYAQAPYASVLLLGDNVYPDGNPADFADRIVKPYRPLMEQGVRFYPVLGNHDVKGGFGDRQLAFWGVPPFYRFTLGPPQNRVDFFALDTTAMLTGTLGAYKDNPEAGRARARAQLAWLDKALAESKAPMKVVYGHYPVYSSGMHGLLEVVKHDFKEQLEPILARHRVDLYLSGHEHHYERTQPRNGVTYIVSGGAGKSPRRTAPRQLPDRAAVLSKNHFLSFEITPRGLAFQAIGPQGEVLDAGLIPRRPSLVPGAVLRRPTLYRRLLHQA